MRRIQFSGSDAEEWRGLAIGLPGLAAVITFAIWSCSQMDKVESPAVAEPQQEAPAYVTSTSIHESNRWTDQGTGFSISQSVGKVVLSQ